MNSRLAPRLAHYFLVWPLVSLCMAIFVAVFMFDVPKAALLMRSHITTAGLVTNIDTANHGVITVRFAVGEATYTQIFAPQGLPVGAAVLVRCDPQHPRVALLEDPHQAFIDGLNSSAAVGLYIGTGACFLLLWRSRRGSGSPPDAPAAKQSAPDTRIVTRRWFLFDRR